MPKPSADPNELERPTSLASRRLNTPSAAHYIGYSRSWLDKARANGRGPRFFRMGPRRVFYRQVDLDEFLASHLIETADTRGAVKEDHAPNEGDIHV